METVIDIAENVLALVALGGLGYMIFRQAVHIDAGTNARIHNDSDPRAQPGQSGGGAQRGDGLLTADGVSAGVENRPSHSNRSNGPMRSKLNRATVSQ